MKKKIKIKRIYGKIDDSDYTFCPICDGFVYTDEHGRCRRCGDLELSLFPWD